MEHIYILLVLAGSSVVGEAAAVDIHRPHPHPRPSPTPKQQLNVLMIVVRTCDVELLSDQCCDVPCRVALCNTCMCVCSCVCVSDDEGEKYGGLGVR
jgi:hypothetical protein